MNTLIIYDSQYGNTERIAQTIASTLSAFGQAQAIRVGPAHPVSFQGVDLLVLGCPTQAFRPTPAMQSLLEKVSSASLSGLAVACFDTRVHGPFGSAARGMARKIQKMGISPLLPPQSFFVKGTQGPLESGEGERAATWARMLFDKAEASHPVTQR